MNVPPEIREAFTSAIASSGNSKQEIQLLNRDLLRMRGVTQTPPTAACYLLLSRLILKTNKKKTTKLISAA